MNNDHCGQISTLIGLSQQKDGIALTQALIDSLQVFAEHSQVAVLEVFGERGGDDGSSDDGSSDDGSSDDGSRKEPGTLSIRRFDDGRQRSAGGGCMAGVEAAIRSRQAIQVELPNTEGCRLIIPVAGGIGPLRLVVIEQLPDHPWVRTQVLQIVEIYGNLIQLMDSRERDSLTGLLNRQTFVARFELAGARAAADQALDLSLALLDIDHFKRVNDTYGHLYGDEVLIHFARLMGRCFRYTDCLFRYGGEEFLALLGTSQPDQAGIALERFRRTVAGHSFPGVGQVTVSIGYVQCLGHTLPTTYIDQADQALYYAKEHGRNQVIDYNGIADRHAPGGGAIDLFDLDRSSL